MANKYMKTCPILPLGKCKLKPQLDISEQLAELLKTIMIEMVWRNWIIHIPLMGMQNFKVTLKNNLAFLIKLNTQLRDKTIVHVGIYPTEMRMIAIQKHS
jgi:chorismate mutase